MRTRRNTSSESGKKYPGAGIRVCVYVYSVEDWFVYSWKDVAVGIRGKRVLISERDLTSQCLFRKLERL